MLCLLAASMASTSNGGTQGGVGMVVQKRPKGWSVESTRFHITKVVSCEVISGGQNIPIIGVYLSPSTLKHIPYLEEALVLFRDQ